MTHVYGAPSTSKIPFIILKEGTKRSHGKDVQLNNILVAKMVADIMKTSFGPKGMDKMLVDRQGNIIVTSDGATIMKLAMFKHPIARMLVEVAKSQDLEVGDGTTTVVVLAGSLLANAEKLIQKGIHPVIIVEGYKKALKKAIEVLDSTSFSIEIADRQAMKKAVTTALSAKWVSQYSDLLADLAIDAIASIARYFDNYSNINIIEDIKVVTKVGGSVVDSTLIRGIVLDKEVCHPNMPKKIRDAKIALLDSAFDIRKAEINAKLCFESVDQYKEFLSEKENIAKEIVEKITNLGTNVILCRMNIDEKILHFIVKNNIMAIKRVKRSDLEKIAKATGATILSRIEELTENDLGKAQIVEERKIGENKMVFIEGCENPKALSILLRGATEEIVKETERCIIDALSVVKNLYVENKIIVGGGAPEIEISLALRNYAESLEGKEQLAVQAFADSIEIIPMQLAESSGIDPIDAVTTLRARHKAGETAIGINVVDGRYEDMYMAGILEPLNVKRHALKAAVEAAIMVLKIDDIIIASSVAEKEEDEEASPGREEQEMQ